MSGLIAGLAGAGGAANTAGGYYQSALGNLVNAYGSPAASTFGAEENASLQPQFNTQNKNLITQENALGINSSGAGKANLGDLTANQSATLAGAEAPLYSQALGEYGSILGQEPGAQNQAYQQAINNFYQALNTASSFASGVPSSGSPAQATPPGGDPYSSGGSYQDAGGTYQPVNPYSAIDTNPGGVTNSGYPS